MERIDQLNQDKKLDLTLLNLTVSKSIVKHTKISYEEIYDDRFFHSYL